MTNDNKTSVTKTGNDFIDIDLTFKGEPIGVVSIVGDDSGYEVLYQSRRTPSFQETIETSENLKHGA